MQQEWERLSPGNAVLLEWFGAGDFALMSRALFERAGPYAEVAQNDHMDRALDSSVKLTPGARVALFDFDICHQDHQRGGRHFPSLSVEYALELTLLRNNSAWGLANETLPEAHLGDVLAAAYNPLTPFLLHPHHPVFANFSHALWRGQLPAGQLVDFLGVRTQAGYMCGREGLATGWGVLCKKHAALQAQRLLGVPGSTYLGELPVVDEEYGVWVALLEAVQRSLAELGSGPVRVVEVQGLGLWAARAAAAVRILDPARAVHAVVAPCAGV